MRRNQWPIRSTPNSKNRSLKKRFRSFVAPISEMAKKYVLSADNLLGFVLKVDFNETHFITCDAWKRKCGGVPRGSFILFRIDPRSVDRTHFDRYGQNIFDWNDQMRLYHAALDAYHRGALVVVSNALCPELETLYAEAGILKLMRPKGLGPDRKPQNVEESAFVLDPLRRWSEWKKVGKLVLPKKRPGHLSMLSQAHLQVAAKNPENGKVRPKGQSREIRPGRISGIPKTQRERALENGISKRSQERLDRIARLRPELLDKIAKGELSIKGALKLCEQPQEKIEKNPSIDQLKRIFSDLSEEEKNQFQEWIVFNRSPLKEVRLGRH